MGEVSNNRKIGQKEVISLIGSIFVLLITLLFCLLMTIAADSFNHFDSILDLLMFASIVYGLIASLLKFKQIDKKVLVLTILFFVARYISYRLNGLQITYGGAMMLQAFYLIGINKWLYGGKTKLMVALDTFLFFDIVAVLICFYNYFFRKEYVRALLEKYIDNGMIASTSIFPNPNYAGMMAGAAIVICGAFIINSSFARKHIVLLSPIIILNLILLFGYTGCRSAQTGIMILVLITTIVFVFKKIDSVKLIIGISVIVCFLTMIPLYSLVYWGNNDESFSDVSKLENIIEDASSGRYAIWKTAIISMEGQELFGFGNATTAWDRRWELIIANYPEKVSGTYYAATAHKRQHNGYVAAYNEAGVVGFAILLLLLVAKVSKLRGRFRDGQWEKLLLIYILWINLFEAKFVMHVFFTGFLMMILLLPPEEGQSEQLEKKV